MSKLMFFDFNCPTCGEFEDLVKPDVFQVPCPKCSRNADRLVSVPHLDLLRMAVSPSASPESLRYYDRVHRQRKAIEEKRDKEHGDYGPMAGAD